MSFSAWSALWLAPLIPLLVVFYFLKLRRPRLEIPSLVLWTQVLNDNRVNSPFQKFKRNILLILQLILLCLLILAAMQPFFRGDPDNARNTPILIDTSASMSALDKSGGQSRLAEAKERVQEIIDGLVKDQQISLVAFGRTAKKLTGFTNNKRVLTDALNAIEIQDVNSDIEDAMRLVQALSRTARIEKVLMLSDGNFPTRTEFDLSFDLDFQQLKPGGSNMGITALNARHAGKGRWDVFVSVEASSPAPISAAVQVLRDGEEVDEQDVTASNDVPQRLAFSVVVDEPTTIEVKLKPDQFDSLGSDNVGYLNLNPGRSLWVYLPKSMKTFRGAMRGVEDITLFPKPTENVTSETDFDLVISADPKDVDRKAAVTVVVGHIPVELNGLITMDKTDGTTPVDWQRNAEVLKFVELKDMVILDNPVWGKDVQENHLEALGHEVIAHGRNGPLLLRKREGERLIYHLLFNPNRSTFPYRVGFPILLQNVVRIGRDRSGLAEVRGNQTGTLPKLAYNPEKEYNVTGPNNLSRTVKTDEHGVMTGVPAVRVGKYEVKDGSTLQARVGVSLLSSQETMLTGVKQIQFNEEIEVAAADAPIKVDKSLWPLLATLALIMLAVEWWFYQKRPTGRLPTATQT